MPTDDAKEAAISIIKYKKNGDTKTITSQKFRTRDLPKPEARLGGINEVFEPVSKNSLLIQGKLIANAHPSFQAF